MRDDLDRLARASAMLEIADQLAQEGEVNPRLYRMLLGALRTLAGSDSPLVVPAFFFKVLALEGYRPEVERCVLCGDEGPLVAFDVESGGLLCRTCRRGTAVSPDAVALLGQILGGRLNEALAAPAGPGHRRGRPPGHPHRRAPPRASDPLGHRPRPLTPEVGAQARSWRSRERTAPTSAAAHSPTSTTAPPHPRPLVSWSSPTAQ